MRWIAGGGLFGSVMTALGLWLGQPGAPAPQVAPVTLAGVPIVSLSG